MNSKEAREFFEALDLMAERKGISPELLSKKLKGAIALAVKKQYNGVSKVHVDIDRDNAKFNVSFSKLVVDCVKNRANEISLPEAMLYSKEARIGEFVEVKVDSKKIGRLAAQAAKQQILQIIREIEREAATERMENSVGKILNAKVFLVDSISGDVTLEVGKDKVVLFKNRQLKGDVFYPGDMVKVLAVYVDEASSSIVQVSRTHPDFIRKIFEMEIPEVGEGKIEVKEVAREAGIRSKVAVISNDPNLDPIGCCIGNRGVRINTIIGELNGEKIDVIEYTEDLKKFIASALLPAKVLEVEILDRSKLDKVAFVSVPDSQISLAIGNRGLNAKLAAILTGFKIDVSPESGFYGENSNSSLKERVQIRLKEHHDNRQYNNQINIYKFKEDGLSEIDAIEEYDIHALEVENMLNA